MFYPFNFAFKQRLNVDHVDEWMSLDFHGVRGKILFGMMAATIVLALVRKRRWRVDELAFVLVGFYAAVTYSRFLFLAAIVVTRSWPGRWTSSLPTVAQIDKNWLNAASWSRSLGLHLAGSHRAISDARYRPELSREGA